MGKKRRRHKVETKPRKPFRTPAKTVLLAVSLATMAVLVLGGVGFLSLHGGASPPLPVLDLSEMEPQVSTKIEAHRQAVLDDPESQQAWGELGVVLQAHGMEAEAAECYRQALALAPDEFRWRYLLAHALRDDDRAGALLQAARASELRPDYAPTYIFRAELLEEDGEVDRAAELYQKALSLDDANAMAHFGMGRILLSRGELDRSREHLLRAKELSPGAGAIRASLAQVYRRQGDREKAMTEARGASELQEPVGVADPIHFEMRQESVSSIAQLDRALAAMDAGDYGAAEEILRELVELRPDDADMQGRLGDALAQQQKLASAKAAYLAALAVKGDHAAALFGLANVLNLEGEHEEAERRYRESLSLRPEHVPTLLNLGSLRAFRGDPAEAMRLFELGLEIDPRHFGCHRQLGELLLRLGKLPEAIEHLRAALEIQPQFGPLHATLAAALAQSGDWNDARQHLEQAKRLGVEPPQQLLDALKAAPGAR